MKPDFHGSAKCSSATRHRIFSNRLDDDADDHWRVLPWQQLQLLGGMNSVRIFPFERGCVRVEFERKEIEI
ncbi:hypothetical protein CEXT_204191 [Caerostris extrusa]|uniref:Uncharacterized protein n=1 Tax=Caerostris extrusa TaxID=172846 RepID=A0AAV4UT49_CAEEX|nr:hypothetical protein CEXT_204191 [Caerostris extrusa]